MQHELSIVLNAAAATILDRGFVSSKESADTGCGLVSSTSLVKDWLSLADEVRRDRIIPKAAFNAQSADLAFETYNWMLDLYANRHQHTNNTFLYNVAMLSQKEEITRYEVGYVVGAVNAYDNARDKRQGGEGESKYLGVMGEGMFFDGLELLHCIPTPRSAWTRFIYKFVDDDGNLVVWFATVSDRTLVVNGVYSFNATVKNHDVDKFTGQPMTVIVRPSKFERKE